MATPAGTQSFPEQATYPVIVIGTRAQLVKMAPVLRELESRNRDFRLIFTGQHLETMQNLLDDFDVQTKPRWLGRREEIDSLGKMVFWFPKALWLLAISRRGLLRGPDDTRGLVIVHGDTISTLLGALAGRVNRCRVAHVESGLRSFSIKSPFPEELTRLIVFRLIDVAFCPGRWARENMSRYRVQAIDTGANTLLDAVRYATGKNSARNRRSREHGYCVVSIHRHENLSSPHRLSWILGMVQEIARLYPVRFVLHPATKARLLKSTQLAVLEEESDVQLRDRMGFLSFMQLLSGARFVLTDGGSNQEELSYLGIPTLIARERTERPEGLGFNAAIVSPAGGPGWRQQLSVIDQRLSGPQPDAHEFHPSRCIIDWLAGALEAQGHG